MTQIVKLIEERLSTEQLRSIGLIALGWNTVENEIDLTLQTAFRRWDDTAKAMTSRINGFDGKVAIIKEHLLEVSGDTHSVTQMPGGGWHIAEDSLGPAMTAMHEKVYGAAAAVKVARDRIVHTIVISSAPAIGQTKRARGRVEHVSLEPSDLLTVLVHLDAVVKAIGAHRKVVDWAANLSSEHAPRSASLVSPDNHLTAVKQALYEAETVASGLSRLPQLPQSLKR